MFFAKSDTPTAKRNIFAPPVADLVKKATLKYRVKGKKGMNFAKWNRLSLAVLTTFMFGCGADKPDEAEYERRYLQLRSEYRHMELKLAATEETLNARAGALEETRSELEGAVQLREELLREKADLEKRINDAFENSAEANARLEEIRAELNANEENIANLQVELQSREQDIARLQGELEDLRAATAAESEELREMKVRMEKFEIERGAVNEFIANIMGPIKGLWKLPLERSAGPYEACSLFVYVENVSYGKSIVCGKDEIVSDYEGGRFADVEKLSGQLETPTNVEFTRRPETKPLRLTCSEGGYLTGLKAIHWTKGSEDILAAEFPNTRLDGLFRDEEALNLQNCDQILTNENRPGLEQAVHACLLFQKAFFAPADEVLPDIGCFKETGGGLSFER
jgi:hypothetical protein